MRLCLFVIIAVSSICLQALDNFKLGLEAIEHTLVEKLAQQSVGLVTNHTGHDQRGVANVQVLKRQGIAIKKIFTPEHGFYGTIKAGVNVDNEFSKNFDVPLVSLYRNGEGKKIQESMLQDIDCLMFDMQDVGMRHYTYLSTLFQVMDAAARYNKMLVILDRPNPLGGVMEGPLVDTQLHSFISIASIPLRHGMTFGELAHYFNNYIFNNQIQLYVVPMQNYSRNMKLPAALFRNISPNIPTLQSIYGYSFLGLLGEVRPCDVGIGTSHPFGYVGLVSSVLPLTAWQELQSVLSALHVPTTVVTYSNERKKKSFTGLQLHIKAIDSVPACTVFIKIAEFLKKKGVQLTFSPDFDKAAGTPLVRQVILQEVPYHNLVDFVSSSLQEFYKRAEKVYLYTPAPVIINLL